MRTLKGTVVSAKMRKTIVVRVDILKKHPKYGKHYRASKKFKAHDGKSEYRTGDTILIQETRPLSREKRWRAIELVRRAVETGDEKNEEEKMTNAQAPMTNKAPDPNA